MMPRLVALLPLLVCVTALGSRANAWELSALIALAAAALALIGPRWELDLGRGLVTSAMGAGAGYAAAVVLYDPQGAQLGEVWTRIASAAVLGAAARFLIVGAGRLGTLVLLFVALLAIGQTRAQYYPLAVSLFLLTSVWTISTSRTQRAVAPTTARNLGVATAILALSGALGFAGTTSLRNLHTWLVSRGHSTAFQWKPRVGFSDRLDLGALDGLLDSNTLVFRVRGPRTDHLRGAALDWYESGRWFRSDSAEREVPLSFAPAQLLENAVEITALSARSDRHFVPLHARSLATAPAEVLVDSLGAIKRVEKRGPSAVRFVPGPRDRARPSEPGPFDLQLPRRIRPQLTALAEAWTRGTVSPADKLDAIQQRLLREYRYSRKVPRQKRLDPVLDFLFVHKSGHCEYFATGMALVARAAGIPTRIVTGYRVAERSAFGYYVVRERNAHSWVEAYVPGRGWTLRDPTPQEELPQNREHRAGYAASLWDGLSVGYDDVTEWLASLSVRQTAAGWLAGSLILAWIVARGARRRRLLKQALSADETALPLLDTLLAKLARSGHTRQQSEPLERLAARVPDARAAALLKRYASLRYGGQGNVDQLAQDVAAYRPDAQQ
ncbi:MAG TPA: transglutaminase domain-containing protein [Polyangiaceae bacterium]|nr:transglutaminase domain-containing protein [Polyangiaceae bacterium]